MFIKVFNPVNTCSSRHPNAYCRNTILKRKQLVSFSALGILVKFVRQFQRFCMQVFARLMQSDQTYGVPFISYAQQVLPKDPEEKQPDDVLTVVSQVFWLHCLSAAVLFSLQSHKFFKSSLRFLAILDILQSVVYAV